MKLKYLSPQLVNSVSEQWSRAKLHSNYMAQQSNIQFFLQAGCSSCRPTNSVKALKGKISHSMDLLTPSSLGGLPTLSLTTNSSWLGYCHQRADERHGNPPPRYRELLHKITQSLSCESGMFYCFIYRIDKIMLLFCFTYICIHIAFWKLHHTHTHTYTLTHTHTPF